MNMKAISEELAKFDKMMNKFKQSANNNNKEDAIKYLNFSQGQLNQVMEALKK